MLFDRKQKARQIPGAVFMYMACKRAVILSLIFYDWLIFYIKYSRTVKRFGKHPFKTSLHPDDKTKTTVFDANYIYHVSWAARVLTKTRPQAHVDISSSLYFNGIVSAFIPVKFYDYRPTDLKLSGLENDRADLLTLDFKDNSIQSLSCMHVVEHIGLGRYGDPIDPDGDLKAIKELKRVLAPGGNLLFVVPVGKPSIVFNAHRIYSFEQVTELFKDLDLIESAVVLIEQKTPEMIMNPTREDLKDVKYACGCYWFRK
jgi:SAM-dependent methyltransferase